VKESQVQPAGIPIGLDSSDKSSTDGAMFHDLGKEQLAEPLAVEAWSPPHVEQVCCHESVFHWWFLYAGDG
jgi:hypothetical protein